MGECGTIIKMIEFSIDNKYWIKYEIHCLLNLLQIVANYGWIEWHQIDRRKNYNIFFFWNCENEENVTTNL